MNDVVGYLEAFGSRVRCKGSEVLAIFDDEYSEPDLVGRVRVASSAPVLLFDKADVRMLSLTRDDTLDVYDSELDRWSSYIVKSLEPRVDGFEAVRIIEAA